MTVLDLRYLYYDDDAWASVPDCSRWSYEEYIRSEHWAVRRRLIKARDGGACVRCGQTRPPLQVHHKTYERLGNEAPEDLETLCKRCHREEHHGGWW